VRLQLQLQLQLSLRGAATATSEIMDVGSMRNCGDVIVFVRLDSRYQ
jgi:hypothetical protein